MKTVRKKKGDPVKPVGFRPGAVFGQFLPASAQQKTPATRQEVTVRDRMNQVKATWVQSLIAIGRQRDLSSSRSPRLRDAAYRCGSLGSSRAHADRGRCQ